METRMDPTGRVVMGSVEKHRMNDGTQQLCNEPQQNKNEMVTISKEKLEYLESQRQKLITEYKKTYDKMTACLTKIQELEERNREQDKEIKALEALNNQKKKTLEREKNKHHDDIQEVLAMVIKNLRQIKKSVADKEETLTDFGIDLLSNSSSNSNQNYLQRLDQHLLEIKLMLLEGQRLVLGLEENKNKNATTNSATSTGSNETSSGNRGGSGQAETEESDHSATKRKSENSSDDKNSKRRDLGTNIEERPQQCGSSSRHSPHGENNFSNGVNPTPLNGGTASATSTAIAATATTTTTAATTSARPTNAATPANVLPFVRF